MADNDRVRKSISWTIDDIATIQKEMGCVVADPGDREAYDIIARIERRLRSEPTTDKRHDAAGEAA